MVLAPCHKIPLRKGLVILAYPLRLYLLLQNSSLISLSSLSTHSAFHTNYYVPHTAFSYTLVFHLLIKSTF